MNEEIKQFNEELRQLKDALNTFTESVEEKINCFLNRIEFIETPLLCDERLQNVINMAKDLCGEPNPTIIDMILFDLILAFFNVYGLENEQEIFELYRSAMDTNYDDDFDFLNLFENEPTSFNLMLFLKAYCKYMFFGTDFNFSSKMLSVVNYNRAMQVVLKLKENGFNYSQFSMVKKSKTFTNIFEHSSISFYDLLMIKDLTDEQIEFLKNEEAFDFFLFFDGIGDQCLIGI